MGFFKSIGKIFKKGVKAVSKVFKGIESVPVVGQLFSAGIGYLTGGTTGAILSGLESLAGSSMASKAYVAKMYPKNIRRMNFFGLPIVGYSDLAMHTKMVDTLRDEIDKGWERRFKERKFEWDKKRHQDTIKAWKKILGMEDVPTTDAKPVDVEYSDDYASDYNTGVDEAFSWFNTDVGKDTSVVGSSEYDKYLDF